MNNIVVIGGGIAGYTAAFKLVSENNKVTLIEKSLIGGTCLNKGCIPTKSLINLVKSNQDLKSIKKEKEKTVQNLRSALSSLISAKKITFIQDEAKILDNSSIFLKQANKKIDYDKLILAIGSKPIIPQIFCQDNVLNSDEILELNDVPPKLVIVGAGYVGIEMAHIFHKLGSKVSIVEKMSSILPIVNKSATDILETEMRKKGMEIITDTAVEVCLGNKAKLSNGDTLEFDKMLVSIGRLGSTIESEIDIEREGSFIKTDDYFNTSQPNIYAIGDCVNGPLLAHKAEYDADILARNLIHNSKEKKDYLKIPSLVFSEPAIANIGTFEGLDKVRVEFSNLGKSYCDNSTKGFLEIYLDKDKIIHGGLVVNNNAQEILAALIPIVYEQMSCEKVLKMVFVHPTSSEIIKETVKKALR